jgi:hypothetical protein
VRGEGFVRSEKLGAVEERGVSEEWEVRSG